jgi:hypothetical protein
MALAWRRNAHSTEDKAYQGRAYGIGKVRLQGHGRWGRRDRWGQQRSADQQPHIRHGHHEQHLVVWV